MASILNYDLSGEDAENQVVSSLSVPSIFNLPFKIPFSMKANLHSTCQIKTSKKKETSSFGNEPPWLVLPMQQPITLWDSCISSLLSARPTDACLAAPVDRWILQVTSQHREACWDTWLFFCASRLPKFAFITHQKGSERKKGVQCGAVVDCGSSEGGKSSQGLEKQLSGLLSTRVQQFTEVRRKKRVSVSGKERKSLLHSKT